MYRSLSATAIAASLILASSMMAQPRPPGPPDRAGRGGRSTPQTAPDPNQKPGRVEGRVIHAKTGEPVRKANVTLNTPGPRGGSPRSITTNPDGSFAFEAVDPGSYQLSAERTGFLTQRYMAPGRTSGSSTVTVASGQIVTGLEIKLTPHGVLAGKVLDADGEPIQGVQLTVLRVTSLGGKRRASPSGGATSNDLGEFRIYTLPAGRYYLMAWRSRRMGPDESRRGGGQREDYVPTYFPGATDATGATLLELAPGQELNGLILQLRRMPVFSVRGRLVNLPAGIRASAMRVFLSPGDRDAVLMQTGLPSAGPVRADGSFQIAGVQPGNYTLTASRMDRHPITVGKLLLTVGTSDIDELTFPLSEPATVVGSVRMENGEPVTGASSARVYLNGNGSMFGGYAETSLKPDGTFRMENVSRDTFQVSVSGLPGDAWVRSVKMGNQEIAGGSLDLANSGSLVPLEIVLSNKVGTVEGSAKLQDKPAGGRQVTLVPDPFPIGQANLIRTASTSDDGSFLLRGIPPGEYRIYAWDEITRDLYSDPEFLKKFENASSRLSVKENSTGRVDLKIIEVEDSR